MIYCDNAATSGYKPSQVFSAMKNAMETMGNSGRGISKPAMEAARSIYDVRCRVADFFDVPDASHVIFTSGATESLNTAIKGVIEFGDIVITTYAEHNSVLRPLFELEKKGVKLRIVSPDEGAIRACIEDVMLHENNLPKALIMTHASNVTGDLYDIKSIGKMLKQLGIIFIVDAAQTAGTFRISMKENNISLLSFAGHKGIPGPQGIGCLLINDNIDVKPLKSGGTGVHSFDREQPKDLPEHLEAGTLNTPGIMGLGAAIDYLNDIGVSKAREEKLSFMTSFYNGIKDIKNVKIYGDFSDLNNRCPVVALNIENENSGRISDILSYEYDIETRSGAHCAPLMHEKLGTVEQGAVRFSFGINNTINDVEKCIRAIKEIAE